MIATAVAVASLKEIIGVHLGDGVTRVTIGESPGHDVTDSTLDWKQIINRDGETPAHPPRLAPGKDWIFIGTKPESLDVVERYELIRDRAARLDEIVLVLREGMRLPTRSLLEFVNTFHAVLVRGGDSKYFYLHDGFVLSAREEQALVEWGVGRPLVANSLLAIGGTLLVAFAQKVWAPAVVGTLLVAAAGYRVQGALTKALRKKSPEWQSGHNLVPSGILGRERVVQGVLVTLVALGDLLGDRVLQLTALTLASLKVAVLEYVGQAYLTWGYAKYNRQMRIQLLVWAGYCAILVAWLCLAYFFAGLFGFALAVVLCCFFPGILLVSLEQENKLDKWILSVFGVCLLFGTAGVGIWAAVLGWDDADLKPWWKWLQPWRWPLVEPTPDSFSTGVRIIGLWVGLVVGCLIAVFIVVGVFS